MNIFYLSWNPVEAAKMLCDKHVVKMVLETAQLLSAAHHVNGSNIDLNSIYKKTHFNHPSSIWARHNIKNYTWLLNHGIALCFEYTHRYGKIHKTQDIMKILIHPPVFINNTIDFTPPPQCMPDKYKCDDTVHAYRNYYVGEKAGFAKWTNRDVPSWFKVTNAVE